MALPTVLDGAVLEMLFWGKDQNAVDLLNVQHFVYSVGGLPEPGGMRIDQVATYGGNAWAGFWRDWQSDQFAWTTCTARWIASFAGLGAARFKEVLYYTWTSAVNVLGSDSSFMLPSYCAYGVRKLTSRPGRGSGQVRVSGVPLAVADDNILYPARVSDLQDALNLTNLVLAIAPTPGNSNKLTPVVIDGRLINVNPGHPPSFYAYEADGLVLSPFVRTQITREFTRRRRHH